MPYRFRAKIKPSEITAPAIFARRRRVVAALAALPAMASAGAGLQTAPNPAHTLAARAYKALTPAEKVLTYTNFYELGPSKSEPAENADFYKPAPWRVAVEGEVHKPREFDLDDLLALAPLEERVYRLRCVEAWSMVIPWAGYSFAHLIRAVEPTGNARYVQFATFNPDELFPDESNASLPWPYVEALRLDEAMHPLTLLTFGVYGEPLTTPNGAPVRMIIPWKYGFKSGKALVKIRFTEEQPPTTWNAVQGAEYGFYANVNPNVNHPRWSQATERAISDSFLPQRQKTEMFNGYGDEVAALYDGMDLAKFY